MTLLTLVYRLGSMYVHMCEYVGMYEYMYMCIYVHAGVWLWVDHRYMYMHMCVHMYVYIGASQIKVYQWFKKTLLSYLLVSPGDILSSNIFMSSLWLTKNLGKGMFTSEYVQEGQSGRNWTVRRTVSWGYTKQRDTQMGWEDGHRDWVGEWCQVPKFSCQI